MELVSNWEIKGISALSIPCAVTVRSALSIFWLFEQDTSTVWGSYCKLYGKVSVNDKWMGVLKGDIQVRLSTW
jgi:hypothetical protein